MSWCKVHRTHSRCPLDSGTALWPGSSSPSLRGACHCGSMIDNQLVDQRIECIVIVSLSPRPIPSILFWYIILGLALVITYLFLSSFTIFLETSSCIWRWIMTLYSEINAIIRELTLRGRTSASCSAGTGMWGRRGLSSKWNCFSFNWPSSMGNISSSLHDTSSIIKPRQLPMVWEINLLPLVL